MIKPTFLLYYQQLKIIDFWLNILWGRQYVLAKMTDFCYIYLNSMCMYFKARDSPRSLKINLLFLFYFSPVFLRYLKKKNSIHFLSFAVFLLFLVLIWTLSSQTRSDAVSSLFFAPLHHFMHHKQWDWFPKLAQETSITLSQLINYVHCACWGCSYQKPSSLFFYWKITCILKENIIYAIHSLLWFYE